MRLAASLLLLLACACAFDALGPGQRRPDEGPTDGGELEGDAGEPTPDGGAVDTCGNGERDGDETDDDCGGSCGGCTNGRSCEVDADCLSGRCFESDCQPAITCPKPSDADFCAAVQSTCSVTRDVDACGDERSANCGVNCGGGLVCTRLATTHACRCPLERWITKSLNLPTSQYVAQRPLAIDDSQAHVVSWSARGVRHDTIQQGGSSGFQAVNIAFENETSFLSSAVLAVAPGVGLFALVLEDAGTYQVLRQSVFAKNGASWVAASNAQSGDFYRFLHLEAAGDGARYVAYLRTANRAATNGTVMVGRSASTSGNYAWQVRELGGLEGSAAPVLAAAPDGGVALVVVDDGPDLHFTLVPTDFSAPLSPSFAELPRVGSNPALALASGGRAALAQVVPSSGALRLDLRSVSGTWSSETIAGLSGQSSVSVALTDEGTLHVATNDSIGAVTYLRRFPGGAWQQQVVPGLVMRNRPTLRVNRFGGVNIGGRDTTQNSMAYGYHCP